MGFYMISSVSVYLFVPFVLKHRWQHVCEERHYLNRTYVWNVKQTETDCKFYCLSVFLIHDEGLGHPCWPQSQTTDVCWGTVSCWSCL